MNVNLNASVSALQAHADRQSIQANNVANVNTDNYKKQRGILKEEVPQGVSLTVDQVNTPGGIRTEQTDTGTEQVETSNVELSEEMPQSMINQRSFEANADVIRTQDEMLGTIMDMKA